jgi:hypothetical protein
LAKDIHKLLLPIDDVYNDNSSNQFQLLLQKPDELLVDQWARIVDDQKFDETAMFSCFLTLGMNGMNIIEKRTALTTVSDQLRFLFSFRLYLT